MNELYRKIFEHLGAAAAAVKEDTTILLINKKFEDIFGINKEEAEGKKKLTDLVGQKYQSALLGQIQGLLNKTGESPLGAEIEFTGLKGESGTLTVRAEMLPDTGLFIFSFCRADGCVLKRVNLHDVYHQLSELVDFLPDPAFVIDRHSRVVAWNRGMEEITGIPRSKVAGQEHIYRSIFYENPQPLLIDLALEADRLPELAEQHRDKYLYIETKNKKIYAENYVSGAYGGQGAYMWGVAAPVYGPAGQLIGAIETIRDVTPQRMLIQALKRSEERFTRIFNTSPHLMIISRLSDGRFLNVNESFLKATGYTREEAIGMKATELNCFWVSEEDRRKKLAPLFRGKSIHNLEIQYVTKSGQERTGLYSAELIEYDGESCILSSINDITELKKMESSLSRLERLNLVGEMAAAIGHEIRNPMTSVRGFLQILSVKPELIRYKDFFNVMLDELDRANSIITEFLSLAKNKPVHKSPLRLDKLVKLLFPLLQANALSHNKHVVIETEPVAELMLDEKEIRQLILNLVMNSLDAICPGQSVTISARENRDHVILSVKDEGPGIKPEVLEKIGTPFFTTKEHGTGLGLPVCFSIANRHNATIKIDTGKNGTTFYVYFDKDKNQI